MAGTRDRIVATTNELFRRRGYHGTSLKDVVSGADATTGSLYHFFPDGKVGLAEAVLSESGDAYQQLFESIYDDAARPAEAIRAFFDGAADVLEQTDFIDICPIGTVALEVASSDERLRLATARVVESWSESLRSRLVDAGVDARDAEELSTTLIATLEGSFMLARARRDADVVRVAGSRVVALIDAVTAPRPVSRSRRSARP